MVHHNPGEPLFETQYTEPAFLKSKGYTGQVLVRQIQCGVTYDRWENNVVPERTEEKLWIERHAATQRILMNNAVKAEMPIYPFIDVLVVPQSLLAKYGDQMKKDGRLSILREKTQEVLKAQIEEIFWRFPSFDGLTVRHGETYVHDTPFHKGTSPAITPEEHAVMINILREEVCVKRNKKLFYRTWDFGYFHTDPEYYLNATGAVEPHDNLFFCIKNINADFQRGYPFNVTIGIGEHQQIIELSTNYAGLHGRSSHPYYIGRGVIEGWSELQDDDRKGIADLYHETQVRGVNIWTWGDGWKGPYFDSELWINLNEYILRNYALNPENDELLLFNQYAKSELGIKGGDIARFRELCLLSEDAAYYGQSSRYFKVNSWWCRDQFLTGINLKEVVKKDIKEKVLAEKAEAVAAWHRIEELAYEIQMPDKDNESFLRVSSTYGRIKYEIISMIWQMQVLLAEQELGKIVDMEVAAKLYNDFDEKWQEWEELKKKNANCPTLYEINNSIYCGYPPFTHSLQKLESIIKSNN
ncbi:hypothetical protein D1614_18805 [Maribellus luteus]|uniref:Uncharacterized protein n=2 Tax=Maribellus luteus TaxID=2305463 RepID=A0A399SWV4_9BACT|nr:hypothetical protein D1614_18805 [Maribellus luteus]